MGNIESKHPRSESLKLREKLAKGLEKGITSEEGLTAHGRGEAFDYLIGEETTSPAEDAIKTAAAMVSKSKNPVFSVNGNVAALVPECIGTLDKETKVNIEINLFHESEEREKKIYEHLKENGTDKILGIDDEYMSKISEIKSNRKFVDERGQKSADVIIVPLEDGDRTEKLVDLGKKVIAVDLNPFSRTAEGASVTIVDNIVRTMPKLIEEIKKFNGVKNEKINDKIDKFDNEENLEKTKEIIFSKLKNHEKE